MVVNLKLEGTINVVKKTIENFIENVIAFSPNIWEIKRMSSCS